MRRMFGFGGGTLTFVFCLAALPFGGGILGRSSCLVPSGFGVVLELTGCFAAALFSKSSRLFVEFLTVSFRSLNTGKSITIRSVKFMYLLCLHFSAHIQQLVDIVKTARFLEKYYCYSCKLPFG